MSLTRPLSCPRARVVRRRLSNVFRATQPFRLANDFRRGPGREKLENCWLVAPLLAWLKSPASASLAIFSLRDCASSARRSIWLGTLPPRTVADSPVCYRLQSGPLHCAGFIPQPTFHSFANLPRQPGEIRALPNDGQSGTDLVAALLARLEPSLHFRFSLIALGRCEKMAARLRPARTSAIRREALPVAEDENNSTARLRPVQATSIIREIGHFCPASIAHAHCGGQKQPNSLRKIILTDTPALGFAACWSRLKGWTKVSRPSFRYAPAAGSQ